MHQLFMFTIDSPCRAGLITCLFIVFGYLSGSVLYGYFIPTCLFHVDTIRVSKDGNPGVANAYMYGGFWCGTLVLCMDLFKGFLPVFLWRELTDTQCLYGQRGIALVAISAVAGHAFSCFYHMKGGKSIAVSFGVLLGLFPDFKAVLLLAFFYIFFSVVIVITPHIYRSIVTYICWVFSMLIIYANLYSWIMAAGIAGIVILKHCMCGRKEKMTIRIGFLSTKKDRE